MRPFNGGGEMIRSGDGLGDLWRSAAQVRSGHAAIVESIGSGPPSTTSIDRQRTPRTNILACAGSAARINSLRLIGTAKGKGPVISFEMKGAHAHDIATVIDRQGIAVRAGTHCVMPLLERFNVTATCRAPFGMYNTREDVDHLAQAMIKARELFS
jgi:cysteine desulfurase/selenocysteine lyase